MRPKIVQAKPSAEQIQQRKLARRENIRSTQDDLAQRTDLYRRLMAPRVSIATGRTFTGIPLR